MSEKENYLKNITPEITRTVNDLVNRDFENATKEEIEAYVEFRVNLALHEDEREQIRAAREKRIEQSKKDNEALIKASMNALASLEELAKARLKAVEDVAEK